MSIVIINSKSVNAPLTISDTYLCFKGVKIGKTLKHKKISIKKGTNYIVRFYGDVIKIHDVYLYNGVVIPYESTFVSDCEERKEENVKVQNILSDIRSLNIRDIIMLHKSLVLEFPILSELIDQDK